MRLSLPESLVARSLAQLELQGVGLIARVDAVGALQRPAAFATLLAAARTALPLIHTLIVPPIDDAEGDALGLQRDATGTLGWRDPQRPVVVLMARTLAEALTQLAQHQHEVGRACGCRVPDDYAAAAFVGRETVLAAIDDWIATHRTGYLVLVGPVGVGKSWLLAECLRRTEIRSGRPALAHIVRSQYDATPTSVAMCLLARLERRYGGAADRDLARLDPIERFQASLAALGRSGRLGQDGQPEILCLDGADQVTLPPGMALLPAVLPRLPDGVVGIVTARHLEWLRDPSQVTVWDLRGGDTTTDRPSPVVLNDRKDIRTYLTQRNAQLTMPLDLTLVDAIGGDPTSVTADAHGEPPVFFTARKNLEDLEDPLAEPAWRDELRQEVAPWRAAAEVRVRDELLRQERRWLATRSPKVAAVRHTARFWQALAVLLTVEEPVSEETLGALGVWSEALGAVLRQCASLFGRGPLDPVALRTAPYVFDHPAYIRVLARDPADPELPSRAMAVVPARHRQLARACRRWRTLLGPARTYALRHLLAHSRSAARWDQLGDTLLDLDFLQTRLGSRVIRQHRQAAVGGLSLSTETQQTLALRRFATGRRIPPKVEENLPSKAGGQTETSQRSPRPVQRLTGSTGRLVPPRLQLRIEEKPPIPAGVRTEAPQPSLRPVQPPTASAGRFVPPRLRLRIEETRPTPARVRTEAPQTSPRPTQRPTGSAGRFVPPRLRLRIEEVPPITARVQTEAPQTSRPFVHQSTATLDGLAGSAVVRHTGNATPEPADSGRTSAVHLDGGPPGEPIETILRDYVDAFAVIPKGLAAWDAVQGVIHVFDGIAHQLRSDPTCLIQELFNTLVWDWDDSTLLGGRLRAAAAQFQRPWLRLRQRPTAATSRDGALIRTLAGHTAWVRAVSVTPDGATVVSGSLDHTVRVWDAHTGAQRYVLIGHTGPVEAVAVTDNGATIVSGSWDRTVRVWDASTGAARNVLNGHTDDVRSVAVTSDGATIISGSDDRTVRVWDGRTAEMRHVLAGHTAEVWAVAATPDGARIVSGSRDQTVRLWDGQTGALLQTLKGHFSDVWAVAISEDGTTIVSGSIVGLRVWDARTGAGQDAGWDSPAVGSVAVTPDGAMIVSGNWDKTVRVWDGRTGTTGRILGAHTEQVSAVAMTPDGATIVSGALDHTVRVWNGRKGVPFQPVERWRNQTIKAVAITTDGATIISGSSDSKIRVWDGLTAVVRRTFEEHARGYVGVDAVAITPDGTTIVSGAGKGDATVCLWDGRTGALRRTLAGHTDYLRSVAVTPDGATVVSGSWDGSARVWNGRTGALRHVLDGHGSVALTPNGATVVTCCQGGTIQVWSGQTGAHHHTLAGHSHAVGAVAITPDGTTIVSGGSGLGDPTVRVWNGSTGEPRWVLAGHTQEVTALAVTPDGATIASGSRDRTVRVWNARTGICLATWEAPLIVGALSVGLRGSSITVVVGMYGAFHAGLVTADLVDASVA